MTDNLESILANTIALIGPVDEVSKKEAYDYQQQLTKPAGSLGQLEHLAISIAGIQRNPHPSVANKKVIIMAADHGVTVEGVSAYPSDVTAQMVMNFMNGGAAINVLARQVGANVIVIDIGIAAELLHPYLMNKKVAYGTGNIMHGPAMTREQALLSIMKGIEVLEEQVSTGLDLVAIGEMGIGNTTTSSAITALILDRPVSEVTGRGTGIGDNQYQRKIHVIEQSLALNQPDSTDPLDILAKVGGLEIGGLIGVILAAATRRIPVVLDGFIASAAALLAVQMVPVVRHYMIAGHRSVERGHMLILERLELRPLLDLDLRLGEGTGAVLAMHLIEGAIRTHNEMATFTSAGVSQRIE
jgi:nicotinate-nucleotide--dimethylbenzimidazole phosphoribosyltransferase